MKDAYARDVQEVAAVYGVDIRQGLSVDQVVNVREADQLSMCTGTLGTACGVQLTLLDTFREGRSTAGMSCQHRRVSMICQDACLRS